MEQGFQRCIRFIQMLRPAFVMMNWWLDRIKWYWSLKLIHQVVV